MSEPKSGSLIRVLFAQGQSLFFETLNELVSEIQYQHKAREAAHLHGLPLSVV